MLLVQIGPPRVFVASSAFFHLFPRARGRPACPTFEPEVIWLRVFDGWGSGVTVTHFCCLWGLFLRTSPHTAPQLLTLPPPV